MEPKKECPRCTYKLNLQLIGSEAIEHCSSCGYSNVVAWNINPDPYAPLNINCRSSMAEISDKEMRKITGEIIDEAREEALDRPIENDPYVYGESYKDDELIAKAEKLINGEA